MAASTPSTILLKGEPTRYERDAGGVITPGHLLELGSGNTVVVHSGAGLLSPKWFAVENDIAGDDLLHNYESTEVVQIHAAKPGDEILASLTANTVPGDFLESDGTGGLRLATLEQPVAMALETVTATALGKVVII